MSRHVIGITGTLAIGIEEDISLRVTGTYHRAQRAYTYPGELAPTDPPEMSGFEIDAIDMLGCDKFWYALPVWMLTDAQMDALVEECIREVEFEGSDAA
jgi:hypothetical protein